MYLLSLSALVGLLASSAEAAYPVVRNNGGFNTATGARPDRLEINGFASRGGPQWDLFILCFAEVQNRPQNQIDSYYQIAGIHGRPYISWDGVGPAPEPHADGYCPHGSTLFPTWHRPYIQLLEQNIWQCAQRLATRYPSSTRQQYVDAAVTLRFPYWDWVKTVTIPTVASQQTITVTNSTGRVTIPNPLYSYTFHPRSSTDFPDNSPPQSYPRTVRTPDNNGNTNTNAANAALRNQAGSIHDSTYNILTRTPTYSEFSTYAFTGSAQGYGSVEQPHGAIHNLVGGSRGHMTALEVSAFDPIFWLHHTNVDRLFAIWQALWPNAWDINMVNNVGTYSITSGTRETANTPLFPFSRDSAGTLWTSNPARGTREFGYTYPEIRPWGKTAQQNTADVRAAIRALYDPNGNLGRRAKRASKRSQLRSRQTPPLDPSSAIVDDGTYKSWSANLQVDRFALPTSFSVFFFVGKPSTDAANWVYDQNLVASFAVLRPPFDAGSMIISGTIPLTRTLLDAVDNGPLDNLESHQADPFLKKELNWRIADVKGKEVPLSQVPSLKVVVVDEKVTPPKGLTDLPKYGEVTPHLDITAGKQGGVRDVVDPFFQVLGFNTTAPPPKQSS